MVKNSHKRMKPSSPEEIDLDGQDQDMKVEPPPPPSQAPTLPASIATAPVAAPAVPKFILKAGNIVPRQDISVKKQTKGKHNNKLCHVNLANMMGNVWICIDAPEGRPFRLNKWFVQENKFGGYTVKIDINDPVQTDNIDSIEEFFVQKAFDEPYYPDEKGQSKYTIDQLRSMYMGILQRKHLVDQKDPSAGYKTFRGLKLTVNYDEKTGQFVTKVNDGYQPVIMDEKKQPVHSLESCIDKYCDRIVFKLKMHYFKTEKVKNSNGTYEDADLWGTSKELVRLRLCEPPAGVGTGDDMNTEMLPVLDFLDD